MSKLDQLRVQIDELDQQLEKLLMNRRELVDQVFDYKKQNQLPMYCPEREKEIIQMMSSKVSEQDSFKKYYIQMITEIVKNYRTYMVDRA